MLNGMPAASSGSRDPGQQPAKERMGAVIARGGHAGAFRDLVGAGFRPAMRWWQARRLLHKGLIPGRFIGIAAFSLVPGRRLRQSLTLAPGESPKGDNIFSSWLKI